MILSALAIYLLTYLLTYLLFRVCWYPAVVLRRTNDLAPQYVP